MDYLGNKKCCLPNMFASRMRTKSFSVYTCTHPYTPCMKNEYTVFDTFLSWTHETAISGCTVMCRRVKSKINVHNFLLFITKHTEPHVHTHAHLYAQAHTNWYTHKHIMQLYTPHKHTLTCMHTHTQWKNYYTVLKHEINMWNSRRIWPMLQEKK